MKHNSCVFHRLAAIVDKVKQQHVEQHSSNTTSSSPVVCRSLLPDHEYKYADTDHEYLSSVRRFSNRRLLSRLRCGCNGLHIDTGRWVDTKREDRPRLCRLCHSFEDVEDERLIAQLNTKVMSEISMIAVFGRALLLQTFSIILSQMHVVVFSESGER